MFSSRMRRFVGFSAIVVVVCAMLAGCSAEKQTLGKLHGVWYEDQTGQPYDFISDTELVLPTTTANGSNAVAYQVVGGDRLSMTQGTVVHVIQITKLDSAELDTQDPAAASTNKYFRSVENTSWAKTRAAVAANALVALKRFPTIRPSSQIVWASTKPTDPADVWVSWPTSSIARYAKAWDWTSLTRDQNAGVITSGTASSQGIAVDINRKVPTAQELIAYQAATGQVVAAGLPHIAVGYSDGMQQYPAGTFVYTNGRLLYSLGGGYAINVKVGPTKADGFAPGTHS